MRAQRRELGSIFAFRPRIGNQVGGAVELLGVYEQRHDHPLGPFKRLPHKAQMPVVQGSHGRHNTDRGTRATPLRNDGAQLAHSSSDRHAHVKSPAFKALT